MTHRKAKEIIKKLIYDHFTEGIPGNLSFSQIDENPKYFINPILSFLTSTEPLEKWGAVALTGYTVSKIAQIDIEWARVTIRRLMWYINEESGGMGWGVPEAIGEILKNNKTLAEEYHHILFSYIDPEGNQLDNEFLLEGALWGIARVCARWNLSRIPKVDLYLSSPRAPSRAFAGLGLTFSRGGKQETSKLCKKLLEDSSIFLFFWDNFFGHITVKEVISNFERWKMKGI